MKNNIGVFTILFLAIIFLAVSACKKEENDRSSITDPRDGQTYKIVTSGEQIWFAENLNYETPDSWWYENDPANGEIYGKLYTWEKALYACPSGWHLPNDDEWKTLEMYLGMNQSEVDKLDGRGTDEGKKMKSTSGWDNNGNGTNSSGFNALQGGFYHIDEFVNFGGGNWWTATENDQILNGTTAWSRSLWFNSDQVYRRHYYKWHGFSVRCLKD